MDRGEFITPEHWLKLLSLNVDGEMTDAAFREFVKHNLPTVAGFKAAMNALTEDRKPGWNMRPFDAREDTHYDRAAESFRDK